MYEKLEKAGKVVGAITAIVVSVAGVGSWVFGAVMAERDQEIESLREDVNNLKSALRDEQRANAASFEEIDEDFEDLRIALMAVRAELTFRTSHSSEGAAVTIPTRSRHRGAGVATSTAAVRGGRPLGDTTSTSSVEVHDANSAAEVYNAAIDRMEAQ